jgi:hypothetical protein
MNKISIGYYAVRKRIKVAGWGKPNFFHKTNMFRKSIYICSLLFAVIKKKKLMLAKTASVILQF